jgi:Glycosyl transferase family group 2
MNFALNLSYNVEEKLSKIERTEGWTDSDEERVYEEVLDQVVKEDGRAWAAGDIRLGDIILIVDSDTRVPEDCLLDAATEFHDCPDIAILQHKSGVMQVVHNYWENGITYFTRLIYVAITYAVAAGDAGPFVGYMASNLTLIQSQCLHPMVRATGNDVGCRDRRQEMVVGIARIRGLSDVFETAKRGMASEICDVLRRWIPGRCLAYDLR